MFQAKMDHKQTNFLPGVKAIDESLKVSKGWGKVKKVVDELKEDKKQYQTEVEQEMKQADQEKEILMPMFL